MPIEVLKNHKVCDGVLSVVTHISEETKTPMKFGIYIPNSAPSKNRPVLYWLSGLTCTEDNFLSKAGAFKAASEQGLTLVVPDTSPRGAGIAGEDDSWDFGTGAGFYVDATEAPWEQNYRMYSYVSRELPALVQKEFDICEQRQAVSGHSMGGHGALVVGLRNPQKYRSISAFAPICAPVKSPWGIKAFSGYLGQDQSTWADYDASLLLAGQKCDVPILVDQGEADEFLSNQLLPQELESAASSSGSSLTLRLQPGYDHSYYFISSFIDDHIQFHAKNLKA